MTMIKPQCLVSTDFLIVVDGSTQRGCVQPITAY